MRLPVSAVKTDAGRRFFRISGNTATLDLPAFDTDGLAADKGFGNLFPGRFDNPPESLARNLHLPCRIGMVQPFEIGKTQ